MVSSPISSGQAARPFFVAFPSITAVVARENHGKPTGNSRKPYDLIPSIWGIPPVNPGYKRTLVDELDNYRHIQQL